MSSSVEQASLDLSPAQAQYFAFMKDVIASVVGSTCCVYTGQPFDTVKVRMQVQAGKFNASIYDCLKMTVQNEGFLALWKGSVPALVGALSENAAAFGINGMLKRIMGGSDAKEKEQSFVEPFLTGGFTGFCTAFVLCPSDVIKCRAQLSRASGVEISVKEIVLQSVRKKGIMDLYTGMPAQIFRDIPFYATFFGTYDIMCYLMKKHTNLPEATVFFMAGGFAGQLAWIASIGQDCIKSRIQTSTAEVTPGIMDTGREIVRTQGIKGVFAGTSVAIIRAFPANAALFLGYEFAKKLFD